MADVSNEVMNKLWYATSQSNWESLLSGLNEIYEFGHISWDQYKDLEYAIKKLGGYGADFPDSPGELWQLLDPWM